MKILKIVLYKSDQKGIDSTGVVSIVENVIK